MAEQTEAEVVRDLALEAAKPEVLDAGNFYAWRKPDGNIAQVDLTDAYPAFKEGTVTVRDVRSFAAYFAKHADSDSEVFADTDSASVTAVLDAHRGAEAAAEGSGDAARWQQHRLVLQLQETLPWRTWLAMNGHPVPQARFAEFLEDNYRDLAPDGKVKAADLLEMAQSFQSVTKLEFDSGQRLSSGDTELTFRETSNNTAGKERKIAIPTEFDLAIAPFDDCAEALITARFRHRREGAQLFMLYVLNNPDRHREAAVKEITGQAAEAIGREILLGQPA